MTDYVISEKGEEVISERHQKDFKKEDNTESTDETNDDNENTLLHLASQYYNKEIFELENLRNFLFKDEGPKVQNISNFFFI